MAKGKSAAELVIEADGAVPMPDVDEEPWMPTPGMPSVVQEPVLTPSTVAIVKALLETPLLVEPTRRFVMQKRSELAMAQLQVLYTPEELEELKQKMEGGS